MSALEIGRIDRCQAVGQRCAYLARINQHAYLVQDAALLSHVWRAVNGPREHQFMVDGYRLWLERHDVQVLRIVDQAYTALRRDQFGDVADVVAGVRCRKYERRRIEAERLDLGGQRLRMVEDVMSAQHRHPFLRLGARGGCDDGQRGTLASDLHRNRANPTGTADDHDRGGGTRHRFGHVQPVEDCFPGSQRR